MVLLMFIPPKFHPINFLLPVTKLKGCPHCCSVAAMDSSSPHCCYCSVVAMGSSFPPPKHPIFLQRCTGLVPGQILIPLRVAMGVDPIQGVGEGVGVGVGGVAAAVVGVDSVVTEVLVFLVEVAAHWVVDVDS